MPLPVQSIQSLSRFNIISGGEEEVARYIEALGNNEFSSKFEDGYGDSYTHSVTKVPHAKNLGVSALFDLARAKPQQTVLDVFGGSGQLKVAMDEYIDPENTINIITADIEVDQIEKALKKGIPAIPLDASDMSIIKDNAVDVVIFAYGFHHLSPDNRSKAIEEAVRITKPKGRVVIHDGMNGGITHRLSYGIIDLHGSVPHEYEHPRLEDMRETISKQRITTYAEHDIVDPHVFFGSSRAGVEALFTEYYKHHYSLPNWDFAQLKEVIDEIYETHQYGPEETSRLVPQQAWVRGRPFEREFYVGPTDRDLLKATFATKAFNFEENAHSVVVGRHAKVFVLEI